MTVPKEISMFHLYDRIDFKNECKHIWIYRKFKGCITSFTDEEPLVFEQKICRKCGKSEFGA